MQSKLILLCIVVAVVIGKPAFAQDSVAVKKITYYNTFMSGVLVGCGSCNQGKDFTFSFVTQHGVRVSPWIKVSAGLGMDVYSDWRLFPVTAGITIDPGDNKNSLYFHANAGHAWGRYLYQDQFWGQVEEQGGFTANLMLGYRIGNEKTSIYIQAGYKHQLAYLQGTNGFSSTEREYELNRFVLQFGFGFN